MAAPGGPARRFDRGLAGPTGRARARAASPGPPARPLRLRPARAGARRSGPASRRSARPGCPGCRPAWPDRSARRSAGRSRPCALRPRGSAAPARPWSARAARARPRRSPRAPRGWSRAARRPRACCPRTASLCRASSAARRAAPCSLLTAPPAAHPGQDAARSRPARERATCRSRQRRAPHRRSRHPGSHGSPPVRRAAPGLRDGLANVNDECCGQHHERPTDPPPRPRSAASSCPQDARGTPPRRVCRG